MRKIGEDVAEILDYVPARFRVFQHVRPRSSRARCERIVQVAAPSRPIERGMAGAGRPFAPLPAGVYAREGVELERSTLAERAGGCVRLFDPLIEALARYVMAAQKLHADDNAGAGTRSGARSHQDRQAVDVRAG